MLTPNSIPPAGINESSPSFSTFVNPLALSSISIHPITLAYNNGLVTGISGAFQLYVLNFAKSTLLSYPVRTFWPDRFSGRATKMSQTNFHRSDESFTSRVSIEGEHRFMRGPPIWNRMEQVKLFRYGLTRS